MLFGVMKSAAPVTVGEVMVPVIDKAEVSAALFRVARF